MYFMKGVDVNINVIKFWIYINEYGFIVWSFTNFTQRLAAIIFIKYSKNCLLYENVFWSDYTEFNSYYR